MYTTVDERGEYDLAASTAMRAFVDNQVVETTGLLRTNSRDGDDDYTRLDTHWTWSSQDDLLTVTAGDFISGGLSWSRATRLGGLQLRRNFSLQPDLVVQPLPAFFGEAALPSQVELYVEGLRQYSGEVLPGAYRIDSAPTISGLSQAQMVLTDALGRTTVQDFSFTVPLAYCSAASVIFLWRRVVFASYMVRTRLVIAITQLQVAACVMVSAIPSR